jgi:DNA mismatch endonuclease (patch repair protein)
MVHLSKLQLHKDTGLNLKHIANLREAGVLKTVKIGRRMRLTGESVRELERAKHYVVCAYCKAWQGQISQRHLTFCSGKSYSQYIQEHPSARLICDFVSRRKAKTETQKRAQSKTLKERFKTPQGEITRAQISQASQALMKTSYRERAANHLRVLNRSEGRRKANRAATKSRWRNGELREIVESWHSENREASLASAAYARTFIQDVTSKLHLDFKSSLCDYGLCGFDSEIQIGPYLCDEVDSGRRLVLEIQGCYWHSCPVCQYEGPSCNIKRDVRKLNYLQKRGWAVLYIWEHEIRQDLSACLRKVDTFYRKGDIPDAN